MTSSKRDIRTDRINETTEVSSNGHTVWVNAPLCVARFCPVSREFQPTMEQFWCVEHPDMTPSMQDWQDFVSRVQSLFGVAVAEHHRPIYLGGPSEPVSH